MRRPSNAGELAPGSENDKPSQYGPHTKQWAEQVTSAGLLPRYLADALVTARDVCMTCRNRSFAIQGIELCIANLGIYITAVRLSNLLSDDAGESRLRDTQANVLVDWCDETLERRKSQKRAERAIANAEARRATSDYLPIRAPDGKTIANNQTPA